MPKQIGRKCNKLYIQLGLTRNASLDEIKHAYREKAKFFHPDLGGDADIFSKIHEAYKVLSDPKAKSRYDQTGEYSTIEDSGNGAIKRKANEIIIFHFKQLCDNHKEGIIFLDIFSNIRANIRKDLEGLKKQLKSYENGLSLIQDILNRTEYSGESFDVLEGVMLKILEQNEIEISGTKNSIESTKTALKLLKNYKFNRKLAPIESMGIFSTSTTATTGW